MHSARTVTSASSFSRQSTAELMDLQDEDDEDGLSLSPLGRDAGKRLARDEAKKRKTAQEAQEAQELRASQIEEYMKYLSNVPELKTLLAMERRKIAAAMTEREFRHEEVICHQGDSGDTFYVLKSGSVRIIENGVEVKRLTADPGTGVVPYFGEKALFNNQPRNATVMVCSQTAAVLALDRESFTLHLGPLEYFFGIGHGEFESEEVGEDGERAEQSASVARSSIGDPFTELTGHSSHMVGDVSDGKAREDPRFIDNKLWALGMSHEQLEKSAIQKQRAKLVVMSTWPRWRTSIYKIQHTVLFKIAAMFFIILNVTCLCVIVSLPPNDLTQVLRVVTMVCKTAFGFELAARIASCSGPHWSGWLRLDMLIFLMAVVEVFAHASAEPSWRGLNALGAVQSIRLVRITKLVKKKLTPVRVMLTALSSGLSYVSSAGVFVGIIWFTAAICFTALLGHSHSEDEEVQQALNHFTSMGRSFLTALEVTVGGLCWGPTIFDPLVSSDRFNFNLGGVFVMILVILSSFLIWNLVLGIYVRQVTMIYQVYDSQQQREMLCDGESSVKDMRAMLQKLDTDRDGCISEHELNEYLLSKRNAVQTLRLGPQEVRVLHATLDADGSGKVPISDLLLGVLKLTGASKSLDMLNIDYRQKALLRCITQLEKTSEQQLDALSADLDALYAYASYLDKRIRALHKSVDKAKGDLLKEIERLQRLADRARKQAQQNQMLVDARRKKEEQDVRTQIENHLESLEGEIRRLARERQLRYLCSGQGMDLSAIRLAVRERLDKEVGPWLDRELAALKVSL